MSSQETRDRLIAIIKEHQLQHGQSKLPVSQLADAAGISRQAFNRYYGDLKEYSLGKESIAKLLVDDNASLSQIIENSEGKLQRLQRAFAEAQKAHERELQLVTKNYVSTLMNNDVMAFEAGQLTSTLTNQSNHNAFLNKRVTELEVKNAKLTIDAVASANAEHANHAEKTDKNFTTYSPDLAPANKAYAISKDFNLYEDEKDAAISRIFQQIKKLPNPESTDVVFFQERYISDFSSFCAKQHPYINRKMVVIRLPVFSREELQLLIRSLQPISSISICVPFTASDAVTSANRKFHFRGTPSEEFTDADAAKMPQPNWGFESIQLFKVRQGE